MHQQFFSLSPMAGQENFGSLDVRPQHLMANTPTTSSMLATLQHDSYGSGSLDPGASAFSTDAYGAMSYMDTSATQDDGLTSGQSGLSFTDFAGPGSTFDVSSFTSQELGINPSGTSTSEADNEQEPVKSEQQGV